jgi:flagellar FliJ protein
MNKRARRMEPVKALRERQVQDEVKKVAAASQAYQSALNQLVELEKYLKDYYADPARGAISFQSARDLVLYQQFVVKINEAIARQRQFVSLKEMGLKAAQRRWLEAKSRVDAIDKLMAKVVAEDEKRNDKREQRAADELAARLHRARMAADAY